MSKDHESSAWTRKNVQKVETSPLFWRDLEDWKNTPLYPFIRTNIGHYVRRVMRGEEGGDAAFTGNTIWGDMRHLHVFKKKIVVFLTYRDDTVRLCAIKPHTFYGFDREKKSMAGKAAEVVIRASMAQPQPFPDWRRMSWRDPRQILESQELVEMSRDALDRLLREIDEEGESFMRLRKAVEKMSPENEKRVADAWLEDLVSASELVSETILLRAGYRKENTPIHIFTDWRADSPEISA